MTSVGRFTRAMHCAIVNVLPEPVTPSRTCDVSPRFNPSTSSSIARAWSPRNSKSVTRLKRSYFDAMKQKIVPQGEKGPGRGSAGLFEGGEVARTCPETDVFQVFTQQLDLDRPPGAIGAQVGGLVAD